MTLEAIQYKNGRLRILDQLKLPHESVYVDINGVDDGFQAIRTMQVRGAPAIAIVGCLAFAAELRQKSFSDVENLKIFVQQKLDELVSARPTAVNMKNARDDLIALVNCDDIKDVSVLESKITVKIEK